MRQLSISFESKDASVQGTYLERLSTLLEHDLDFHGADTLYASHDAHSFPAKFPPQLPKKFINGLTEPGDVVLDPMMGSGTTILEAFLAERKALGFDIDPLAQLIVSVKTSPVDPDIIQRQGKRIVQDARASVTDQRQDLEVALEERWDSRSRKFVNYWFAPSTQVELLALRQEIEDIHEQRYRDYFDLVFSGVIITKSGGVSMALDLAHTRPHRAKIVHDHHGHLVLEADADHISASRLEILTKTLRSPIDEFEKKYLRPVAGIPHNFERIQPEIQPGDAQHLPLEEATVDLIVTSPPYAANAIDYMRAHKFSLVWMGYSIADLGQLRKQYIGGEAVSNIAFEQMPTPVRQVIQSIAERDEKKGRVLHRYYSEMVRTLEEMYRVLKPGAAAVVVVGSSRMRGMDTQTETCLAAIGESIGFDVPGIGIRHLDRDKRMMPASAKNGKRSQIQQRMHKEYVIGFYKPMQSD